MNKRQGGMSLIEMMLVMVVMAIAVLYGVNYLRERQVENEINITTKQMQNLLQMSTIFHSREGVWPNKLDDLVGAYGGNRDFCSPWPGKGNKDCPQKQAYEMTDFASGTNNRTASYFGVSLKLPNAGLAQRVATRIQGAVVSGREVMTYTAAEVPLVSATAGGIDPSGWIHSVGIVADGDRVDMPDCGDGYEGHAILSPQRFSGDTKKQSTGVIGKERIYFNFRYTSNSNDIHHDSVRDPHVSTDVDVDIDSTSKYKNAYFMVVCLPAGRWESIGYDETKYHDDMQCDDNWQEYNKGKTLYCETPIDY